MAINGAAATVPLSPGERLNGLNHIAELRAKVFGLNIESELERFIKDMRDPRGINNEQNKRALAAIFFMAKIPAERHSISIYVQLPAPIASPTAALVMLFAGIVLMIPAAIVVMWRMAQIVAPQLTHSPKPESLSDREKRNDADH